MQLLKSHPLSLWERVRVRVRAGGPLTFHAHAAALTPALSQGERE